MKDREFGNGFLCGILGALGVLIVLILGLELAGVLDLGSVVLGAPGKRTAMERKIRRKVDVL